MLNTADLLSFLTSHFLDFSLMVSKCKNLTFKINHIAECDHKPKYSIAKYQIPSDSRLQCISQKKNFHKSVSGNSYCLYGRMGSRQFAKIKSALYTSLIHCGIASQFLHNKSRWEMKTKCVLVHTNSQIQCESFRQSKALLSTAIWKLCTTYG